MDKIGINLVGLGTEEGDLSARIYNVGVGFRDVSAKITARVDDSIYLVFTSARTYTVVTEGDLIVTQEETDLSVTPFSVDWSDSAKANGYGSGKVIITNPDDPSNVSTFEVAMGVEPAVEVSFGNASGNNGFALLSKDLDVSAVDPAMKAVLSSLSNDPYQLGLALLEPLLKAYETAGVPCPMSRILSDISIARDINPSGDFDGIGHETLPHRVYGSPRLSFGYNDGGPFSDNESFGDIFGFLEPSVGLFDGLLLGNGDTDYHRPEDVLAVGASTEINLEVKMRSFDQLNRTRQNDIARIAASVEAATALGIDTSDMAQRRDELLGQLGVFADRFETGGDHAVTDEEATLIGDVFGKLWGLHSDLDTVVSHWHHYKQHEANLTSWEERLATRPRAIKYGADTQQNPIFDRLIAHAANPDDLLASCKAAFVELFDALKRRDLRAAHTADQRACQFSSRECMLHNKVVQGALVNAEPVAA